MEFIKTVSFDGFVNALIDDKYASFTREGAAAIYHFSQSMYDDDEMIEFDGVSIRCEFQEYDDINDLAKDYGIDIDDDMDEDEILEQVAESAQVIYANDSYDCIVIMS